MNSEQQFNANPFENYHCIYWVFTQLCNDFCDHCYNSSGPKGERISHKDCMAIIDNLPGKLDQIILSGGEPLADKKLLYAILDKLREKYASNTFITLQFNGDLLTKAILQILLDKGVNRFSIASIDRYHKKKGERKSILAQMFEDHGIVFHKGAPEIQKPFSELPRTYGFFGSTEEMWLGGNWARGRAFDNNIWKKDGHHNFCKLHSGAISFLDSTDNSVMQELSIQLWKINPCCPGTVEPMGDARKEKISEVLQRVSSSKVMQKLNKGNAYGMGESIGISADEGFERAMKLGNICLWCDEFFNRHFDMKSQIPKNTNTKNQFSEGS